MPEPQPRSCKRRFLLGRMPRLTSTQRRSLQQRLLSRTSFAPLGFDFVHLVLASINACRAPDVRGRFLKGIRVHKCPCGAPSPAAALSSSGGGRWKESCRKKFSSSALWPRCVEVRLFIESGSPARDTQRITTTAALPGVRTILAPVPKSEKHKRASSGTTSDQTAGITGGCHRRTSALDKR